MIQKILHYSEKCKAIVNIVGMLVAIIGLYFLASQTCSLVKQTEILTTQSQMLFTQYEASYRPYLHVNDVSSQISDNSYTTIFITVGNDGQLPATMVSLDKIVIGGAYVEYNEQNGTYTFFYVANGEEIYLEEYQDMSVGIVVYASDYISEIVNIDFHSDFVFFPNIPQTITAMAHTMTFTSAVLESETMHVALEYSWGNNQYFYIAKLVLHDNKWIITESYGN